MVYIPESDLVIFLCYPSVMNLDDLTRWQIGLLSHLYKNSIDNYIHITIVWVVPILFARLKTPTLPKTVRCTCIYVNRRKENIPTQLHFTKCNSKSLYKQGLIQKFWIIFCHEVKFVRINTNYSELGYAGLKLYRDLHSIIRSSFVYTGRATIAQFTGESSKPHNALGIWTRKAKSFRLYPEPADYLHRLLQYHVYQMLHWDSPLEKSELNFNTMFTKCYTGIPHSRKAN